MRVACKSCGSTEVRNDRSLGGRLICAKCGSVDLEVSRGRLEFKLPNIKLEALRKTTQKQRAVIAASLIGVAAITVAIKSQDQQYCMQGVTGHTVCVKRKSLECYTSVVHPVYGTLVESIGCSGYGTSQDQAGNIENWSTYDENRSGSYVNLAPDGYVDCNETTQDAYYTCGAALHFDLIGKGKVKQ